MDVVNAKSHAAISPKHLFAFTKHRRNRSWRGFALVATISVMVLLVMVALAMLSLSTISTRDERQLGSQAEAKANARMALMLALGRLQEQLGPDQRISASSSILDASPESASADGVVNANWLGVWNAATSGNLSYETGRETSFRDWLVSLPREAKFTDAKTMSFSAADGVSLAKSEDGSTATRVPLIDTTGGKFAWHVSDNAMRARLNLPSSDAADIGTLIARRAASVRHAPEVVTSLAALPTGPDETKRLITTATAPLALGNVPTDDLWRQALTAQSVSLMTNVVKGGWRKDINTLFEQTKVSDFAQHGYGTWEGRNASSNRQAYLYGPAKRALGARWNHLHSFYNLYKDVEFDNGVPQLKPGGSMIDWRHADRYQNFGDEAGGFRFPRVAKIVYLFSYTSSKSPSNASRYRLQLAVDVFITLWNPYNTRIVFPPNCCMYIKFSKAIPMRFNWFINDVSKGNSPLHRIVTGSNLFQESRVYNDNQGQLFSMEPGETLFMSTTQNNFRPGATFTENRKFTGVNNGSFIEGGANDRVKVALKPDQHGSAFNIGGQATSQYCDFWIFDSNRGRPYYEHRGEIISKWDAPFIQNMPEVDKDDVTSVSLGQVFNKKQPFGAFIVEMKTAQDSVTPSQPFLHAGISRLSSRLGNNLGEWNTERMDYRLEPITSFNSDLLQATVPTHPAGPNHGFIGSGRTYGTGVTHVMHAGVPLLPMTSLAQFQHAGVGDGAAVLRATHWGFNSTPNPPYMDYAIGNSYAHPLINKKDKVTGNYYDHSFHANEILWDDYFCSSLAPYTQSVFNKSRSMEKVWQDFVRNEEQMLNPRFRPYLGNKTLSEMDAEVFQGGSLDKNAFKSLAANLLYGGGFNVNSISVEAWKAFLSGARLDQVRVLDAHKPTPTATTDTSQGTPFSRTSLPLGKRIDSSSSRQQHYLGYRDLTDKQITQLAEKIVEQVKKRGPFLSIADFVNRQLSTDVEKARSGALQAAIDATDINDVIAANGLTSSGHNKGFAFPQAADGSSAAGSPGWLIQGDLLTPLGPSVFVRGDTFTLRAYGDARNANGDVIARAYCEAVVQRVPDWIDSTDDRDAETPTAAINIKWGRKFEILQFRWLKPEDIE